MRNGLATLSALAFAFASVLAPEPAPAPELVSTKRCKSALACALRGLAWGGGHLNSAGSPCPVTRSTAVSGAAKTLTEQQAAANARALAKVAAKRERVGVKNRVCSTKEGLFLPPKYEDGRVIAMKTVSLTSKIQARKLLLKPKLWRNRQFRVKRGSLLTTLVLTFVPTFMTP
jgi:hypothetical protein